MTTPPLLGDTSRTPPQRQVDAEAWDAAGLYDDDDACVGTMLLMGDEVRRTQRGNNNAYCINDDTSWFDWDLVVMHGGSSKEHIAIRINRHLSIERFDMALREMLRSNPSRGTREIERTTGAISRPPSHQQFPPGGTRPSSMS